MATAAVAGLVSGSAHAADLPQMMPIKAPAGGFVVGTTVGITAVISSSLLDTPQSKAVFADNGVCFHAMFPGMDAAGVGVAWTPTTAGTHVITLTQFGETVEQTVTVEAAPAGTPVPTPETPGCGGGGGSFGTGSFGS